MYESVAIYTSKSFYTSKILFAQFKGTIIQIEKTLISNRLCVSKVSWKCRIPTIYNFPELSRDICYFLENYFLTVVLVFSVYKH